MRAAVSAIGATFCQVSFTSAFCSGDIRWSNSVKRPGQCGNAGCIKRRRYFHDITPNDLQAAKAVQQFLGFVSGDPTDNWGACSRRIGGIKTVHVEGDVDGTIANNPPCFSDDP